LPLGFCSLNFGVKMTAFILVALAAILLMLLVWRWVGLHRKNKPDGNSFAGRSTFSEVVSKEKRKKKES